MLGPKTTQVKMIHVPFLLCKVVSIVSKTVINWSIFIKQHFRYFLGHNFLMLIKRTVRAAVSVDNPHGFPVEEAIKRWRWRVGNLRFQREMFLKLDI